MKQLLKEYPIFDINPEIIYTPIPLSFEPFSGETNAPPFLNGL